MTLSDGKPDDYSDQYHGEVGIKDSQALIKAHRAAVSHTRPGIRFQKKNMWRLNQYM